jgi:hypothetical protein
MKIKFIHECSVQNSIVKPKLYNKNHPRRLASNPFFQIYALCICIIISSTWEPPRNTFSLFNFVYTLEAKTNGWDIYIFLSNSKIKENEKKTKNFPYEGFLFYFYLFIW